MSIEKNIDQYVGDVVGGLIREAAALKAKCVYLESVITELKNKQPSAADAANEMLASR